MPREYTCDADKFAITMETLLKDLTDDVDGVMLPVVEEACRKGTKKVRAEARSYGWKKYPKGFSYTTKKTRTLAVGEIGNRSLPGLVHLLEKGHAKVGGGRTREFRHVDPAAKETFKVFWEGMNEALGDVL